MNYLAFARAHFGRARFDFALSGESAPACFAPPRREGTPRATPLEALEALRAALAAFLDRDPSEVVPCLGTSQAMAVAGACLRGAGAVAIERPVYEPLRLAFEGAQVRAIPREPPRGYALGAAALAAACAGAGGAEGERGPIGAIVFAEPHNPTGARADHAALRAALAPFRGAVVVDEVYAPFDAYVDARGKWPGQGRALHPRAWAIGSLTKAYGLGPYRVGWLAVPPEERAAADEAVVRAVGELPLRWALDALDVLAQVPAIGAELRASLPARRRVVLGALEAVEGLEVHAPPTGPYAWVRVPEGRDVRAAVVRWAAEDGLVASPGVFFGDPRGLRVAWTAPLARLEEGAPLLAARLRELVAGS
jgi:aspartate/methionine/tyrosine aminotransferase